MSSVPTPTGADESGLVVRLTLEQKVRLLTGADSWLLHPESAIGLRPMVLSDGPAGVRGTRFDSQNPSSSLPCPIALGATWDEQLVHDVAPSARLHLATSGVIDPRRSAVKAADVERTLKRKIDCPIPADALAALAAVNFGKPLSEAAPNSGIVKALRPLVAGLDDANEVAGDGGSKKATSALVRFTQGIRRKSKKK